MREKIGTFVKELAKARPSDKLEESEEGSVVPAGLTMQKILLQETLMLGEEADHISLQVNSLEASLINNSNTYEHGALFGFVLIVGFLITALTQIYKDKERFCKEDVDQRIELCKLKFKIQLRQKARQEEQLAAEATARETMQPQTTNADMIKQQAVVP